MATAQMASSPVAEESVLSRLLSAELDYSPGARPPFVNHLAMSLVAARGLGASDGQLEELYQEQTSDGFLLRRERPGWLAERTEKIVRGGAPPGGHPLGRTAASGTSLGGPVVGAVRRTTAGGIAQEVAAHLPRLIDALDARFYHAVIRLEYAVEAQHPGQVANALGDWEEVRAPAPDLPRGPGDLSLREAARLAETDGELRALGRLRLQAVLKHPRYLDVLARVHMGPSSLDEAAELALLAHIAGGNIGTLHLVTGACAARALAPLVPAHHTDLLGARLVQAIFAGYLCMGSQRLPSVLGLEELRTRQLPGWERIRAAALETRDPHVIKLVYACLREEHQTGDRLYHWLAVRECRIL